MLDCYPTEATTVFSTSAWSYRILSNMLENLKIDSEYNGFLFLFQAGRDAPKLLSHHHRELELNLVVRGSITYIVGGQRFTFPAGTLLWLYPQQEHQMVDSTAGAENYVAVFKPSFIRQSCRTARYRPLLEPRSEKEGILHAELAQEAFELVRTTMDTLMVDSLDTKLLSREAGFGYRSDFRFRHGDPDGLNAGLHHLLLLAWRVQAKGQGSRKPTVLHPGVSKALRLLREGDLQDPLRGIATRCGISEPYLSRMFCRQVGISMSRYRNTARLTRFWEEYRRNNGRHLLDCVYAAGFGSYAQFFKVFVAAHGRGPRAMLQKAIPRGSRTDQPHRDS